MPHDKIRAANKVVNMTVNEQTIVRRALTSELGRDVTISGLRVVFERLAAWGVNNPVPKVGTLHEALPIYSDRRDATVDVIVPTGTRPFPVLLYIHGGAWVAGSPATHRRLTYRFAEAGYLVVSVDYRLAPEHPFPAAYDDCVQALRWTAREARRFGGDPSRLAIGGDSAGGNLAAAVAIAAHGISDLPPIAAALLIYGVFDFAKVGGALFAPVMHDAYLGCKGNDDLLRDVRVSPLHGAARLPPSCIVVGDSDPLLEDSRALQRALAAANVPHRLDVVPDMPHAFVQMEFLREARTSIDRMTAFLREWTKPSIRRQARFWLSRGITLHHSVFESLPFRRVACVSSANANNSVSQG